MFKRGIWAVRPIPAFQIKKEKPVYGGFLFFRSGGDLLSHTVSRAVSSAWRVLTSVFGMETGVALALLLPENSLNCKISRSSTAYNWKSIFESGQATCPLSRESFYGQASRSISTGKLNVLPRLHRRPINVVVSNGPLGGYPQGDLVLRLASRLDAFSGYPLRTWLPCDCHWRDNRNTRGSSIPVLSY